VCEDISRPLEEQRGAIIEVNASPGLLAHLKPADGPPRPVGTAIIAHLFAPGQTGRIPIVGVTGTLGTSLIARLVGCLLQLTGKHVGVVSGQGMYLDHRQVVAGDCIKWETGQRLLINRTLQAAVFESNARMILTEGLAYDKCQVGVVTDMEGIESLGLGEFYIRDADAMANVIRTQVDVILPDGVAVLNAENAQVAELAALCDGKVIFYAVDPDNEIVARHRAAGERSVFVRAGAIVIADGANETALLPLAALKTATAKYPASLLAAVAAAWALDVAPELLTAGLRAFDAAPKHPAH
jgi:cyanophycin synthetase